MTDIVVPDGYTREQLVAAADRELALRRKAYPRWVELGKMSRAKAADEIGLMEAILATLRQLPATPAAQPGLFPGDGGRRA